MNFQILIGITRFIENSYLLVFLTLRNNDMSLHSHINVVVGIVCSHHIRIYSLLSMAVFTFVCFEWFLVLSCNTIFKMLLWGTRLSFVSSFQSFLYRSRFSLRLVILTRILFHSLFYRISRNILSFKLIHIKFSIFLHFN